MHTGINALLFLRVHGKPLHASIRGWNTWSLLCYLDDRSSFPFVYRGLWDASCKARKQSVSLRTLPFPHIGILAVKRRQATTLFLRQLWSLKYPAVQWGKIVLFSLGHQYQTWTQRIMCSFWQRRRESSNTFSVPDKSFVPRQFCMGKCHDGLTTLSYA